MVEKMLFRGVILRSFLRQYCGQAILASSLFGAPAPTRNSVSDRNRRRLAL